MLVARPHRRLDAAIGEKSAENDRYDSLSAEAEVEVGANKGIHAALARDHDVPVRFPTGPRLLLGA